MSEAARKLRACLISRCGADEADIRARLTADPWASAGLLRVGTIETWALWLDSRSSRSAP
jgi:hypothetical protein